MESSNFCVNVSPPLTKFLHAVSSKKKLKNIGLRRILYNNVPYMEVLNQTEEETVAGLSLPWVWAFPMMQRRLAKTTKTGG
ncbi:hypothetical protein C0J52_10858 [Blattella germanica]|nr:hypothetical protein C0J52_10858 [Blattella germanica]